MTTRRRQAGGDPEWIASIRLELGETIRRLRVEHGLTQSELAAGVCTKAAISAMETGKIAPSLAMMYALAERLDVEPRDLLPRA